MNTSAAKATLPGGVRAKEISSALYQPQHMPSTKINCRQQGKGEFKFAGRDPYRPALPAAVDQQRGAQ